MGINETDTRFGIRGVESLGGEREPDAARIRPQLCGKSDQLVYEKRGGIITNLASSPYNAVLTRAEVEIRDAIACASS